MDINYRRKARELQFGYLLSSKGSFFSAMNFNSTQDLSLYLISSAFRRCRVSEDLCRLSVVLRLSSASHPPIVQVSVSDTGIGSSLEEFRKMKLSTEAFGAHDWDGVLSVTTTSTSDDAIISYLVKMKECVPDRKLTRLPSKPKNGVKFSGTEVRLSAAENADVLVGEIKHFFQKNVVIELVVEHGEPPGSRDEHLFLANECNPLPFSASHLERLKSGLEDYVLKHGNILSKQCHSCFPSLGNLKVGSGMACRKENHRNTGLVMEAVIIMRETSEQINSCIGACRTKTEVLYFRDFLSTPISQSSLKALTSIDWRSYGLTLGSVETQGDKVLIEWENLPAQAHLDVALHLHSEQIMTPSTRLKNQYDHNLTKKAIKLALDDLRDEHAGVLLSAHAVKIRRYVPDLAKTIAGLILSSEDSHFQQDCFSLLGLQSQGVEDETIEACIKEKINSVIEMNDKKPQRSKDVPPFLFEDECFEEQVVLEDEEYEGEIALSPMDI